LVCGVCKNEFTRNPSHIKGKHGANFCSPICHYKGRSLGLSKRIVYKPYNHTKQGRANRSKAAAHLYASGKGLAFPKTELAVLERLKTQGINVVHQKVVELPDRAYAVDFFFPTRADGGLIIELDNPGRHDRGLMHADFERDKILSELGFEVVRLWDNGRPENAIRAVLDTLLQWPERRSASKVPDDVLCGRFSRR
jgi:very-short-patch-repair endonuclease